MAYDYEKAKAAYESLTPEQQQQYVDRNKNNATVQQFARDYAREKSQASTTTPTPSYQNQGAGNYVYNEKTGFYENQTDTSKNTTNQGIAPRPETKQETIIKETPTKQEEIVVSTDTKNNKTNTLAPLSNDYYQQTSDEALDKIRYNLNGYKQSNPEYFSDYETFKRNFSYDLRNKEQQGVLDDFYKGYEKGLEFSATPINDLYTQYKDGQISLNDLELLKSTNPTKYAELQNQINKASILAAYDDTTPTENKSMQEMAYEYSAELFKKFMSGEYTTETSKMFDEFEADMNSPEMLELQDKTTELDEQYKNIEDQIASIGKDVEKEYEGTGATRSKINAIIADRTYDLQQQLRTLGNEYNKYATQYNNRATQYQNEFKLKLQEYQLNMEARQSQMKELGFAMDLMNFETNEQKQEREWNYWVRQQEYQNGNINSKDYDTRYKAALKSVQNLLSQYEGIPMVRSAEQMAQDVLTAIDNGSNLGAELTKINQQIQQKDEYKKLYNQTFGTASNSGLGKTFSIGGQDYVVYDDKLYTAEEFNKQFSGKLNYTPVSPDVMSTGLENFKKKMQSLVDTGGAIRKGWCGEPVNDYLKSIGSDVQYDNNLETKLNSITPGAGPKVGSIAIWDGSSFNSPAAKEAGHVGIVTAVDEKNGKITVLESNGQAHKMGMGYGTYNMANVTGYFDPTAGYGSQGSSNSNGIKRDYVESRVGLYDRYINEGMAPTDAKLKAIGDGDIDKGWQIFDAEVQDYMDKTGAGTLDKKINDELVKLRTAFNQETAVKDYKSMLTNYTKIDLSAKKKTPQGDMSLIFAYMKMLDPNSVVREGEYATAQNAGNVGDKIINLYNKTITGKKLSQNQRNEFLSMAQSLMDGATLNYNNLLDDYAGYISYGGSIDKVGKRGTYITSEFINKYGNGRSTSSNGNTGDSSAISFLSSMLNPGTTYQSDNERYEKYMSNYPSGDAEIDLGDGLEISRP